MNTRIVLLLLALAAGLTYAVSEDMLREDADPYGTLTITTFPRDAEVEFIGGGIAYEPRVRVNVGVYPLRVSAPGYVTQEFSYEVVAGANFYEVNLQRDFGTLQVEVTPLSADVEVTYVEHGSVRRVTYAQATQIPVGEVEVRAQAPGFCAQSKTIRMDNQGATLSFDLQALPCGAEPAAAPSPNQLESSAAKE